MKRFIPLLMLLICLLPGARALAEDTELLFRGLLYMDRTGDANDYASRLSVISQTSLRKSGGLYTGKIKLGKAAYRTAVRNTEDGGVLLSFSAEDAASMWTTLGSVANRFDSTMREQFSAPVTDVLTGEEGETPLPRKADTGALDLDAIGVSHEEIRIAYENPGKTFFAGISGRKTYQRSRFELVMKFGGSAPEYTAAYPQPEAEPSGIVPAFQQDGMTVTVPWRTTPEAFRSLFALSDEGTAFGTWRFSDEKAEEGTEGSRSQGVNFRDDCSFFGAKMTRLEGVLNDEKGLYGATFFLNFRNGSFKKTYQALVEAYGEPRIDDAFIVFSPDPDAFAYLWEDGRGHAMRLSGSFRDADRQTLRSKNVKVTFGFTDVAI